MCVCCMCVCVVCVCVVCMCVCCVCVCCVHHKMGFPFVSTYGGKSTLLGCMLNKPQIPGGTICKETGFLPAFPVPGKPS